MFQDYERNDSERDRARAGGVCEREVQDAPVDDHKHDKCNDDERGSNGPADAK